MDGRCSVHAEQSKLPLAAGPMSAAYIYLWTETNLIPIYGVTRKEFFLIVGGGGGWWWVGTNTYTRSPCGQARVCLCTRDPRQELQFTFRIFRTFGRKYEI